MMSHDLQSVALTLVATGKGILAADETIATLTRRFDALGIQSTEHSRRTCPEMLFTSRGAAEFISGVIMQDETIRQRSSDGTPLAQVLSNQGILPGIKVNGAASVGQYTDEKESASPGADDPPRLVRRLICGHCAGAAQCDDMGFKGGNDGECAV